MCLLDVYNIRGYICKIQHGDIFIVEESPSIMKQRCSENNGGLFMGIVSNKKNGEV